MSSFSAPPVRGDFNATQNPFLIIVRDTNSGTLYLLCEISYTTSLNPPETIQEILFIPAFTGGINIPYNGSITGKEYFMAGAEDGNLIKGENIDNFPVVIAPGGALAKINYIVPFRGVLANKNLFRMSDEQKLIGLTTEFVNTPTKDKPYVARTTLTSTDSDISQYSISANKDFFFDGTNLYAGYPYGLGVFGKGIFPFRNLRPYSGNLKIINYNLQFNAGSFYAQPVNDATNYLYLNQIETASIGSGNTAKVPMFPGVSMNDSTFGTPFNFPMTGIEVFFMPNSYFPINFNIDSLSGDFCTEINPGANSPPVSILNYLYYSWAVGYPSNISASVGPITSCGPGFLNSGVNVPLNLCGWTTIQECRRSYFYNYCDDTALCSNCYGPCPTKEEPFCDINNTYTRQIRLGKPFLCGSNQAPTKGFNWSILIGVGSTILFLFFIAVLIIAFSIKKKDSPRQSVISS